jgi:hypothetical protein
MAEMKEGDLTFKNKWVLFTKERSSKQTLKKQFKSGSKISTFKKKHQHIFQYIYIYTYIYICNYMYIHFKQHKTCYIISPNVNVNDHQRQPTCFLIVPGAGAVAIGDHPRTIATRLNCLTLLVLVVIPQGQ